MDRLEHIEEMQELMRREVAHEGDSALYVRLAMRSIEIRGIIRRLLKNPGAGDEDAVDALIVDEVMVHRSMVDAHKITREQHDRLFLLLTQDHGDEVRRSA